MNPCRFTAGRGKRSDTCSPHAEPSEWQPRRLNQDFVRVFFSPSNVVHSLLEIAVDGKTTPAKFPCGKNPHVSGYSRALKVWHSCDMFLWVYRNNQKHFIHKTTDKNINFVWYLLLSPPPVCVHIKCDRAHQQLPLSFKNSLKSACVSTAAAWCPFPCPGNKMCSSGIQLAKTAAMVKDGGILFLLN